MWARVGIFCPSTVVNRYPPFLSEYIHVRIGVVYVVAGYERLLKALKA